MYRAIAAIVLSATAILSAPLLAPMPAVAAGGVLSVAPGGFVRDIVACPSGKVAIAGGVAVVGEGSREFGTIVRQTAPDSVLDGAMHLWRAAVTNFDSAAHTIALIAVCA